MNKLNIKYRPQSQYNQAPIVQAFIDIENEVNKAVEGRLYPVKRISSADSPYNMNISDGIIICDTTSGNITINLLPSDDWNEKILIVKKISASNTLTVDGNASETIDGSLTDIITTNYTTKRYIAEGGVIFTV